MPNPSHCHQIRPAMVSWALAVVSLAWPSPALPAPAEVSQIWEPSVLERLVHPPSLRAPVTPTKGSIQEALAAGKGLNRGVPSAEDVERAVSLLQAALGREPDNVEIRRCLADVLARHGRVADALGHYRQLVQSRPADPQLQLELAKCQLGAGQTDDAIVTLQALITKDPSQSEAFYILARKYHDTRHNVIQADSLMGEMVKKNAKSATACAFRALWHLDARRFRDARQDIERALELGPTDLDTLLAAHRVCVVMKDRPRAKQYLETAEKLYPDDARVLLAVAHLHTLLKEPEKVKQATHRALTATGLTPHMLFDVADLQLRAGDVAGARASIAVMTRARLRPELIAFFEARVLMTQEKWLEARTALEQLAPKTLTFSTRDARLYQELGTCYEHLRLDEQALDAYQRALHADPKLVPARIRYAMVLSSLKKMDDACNEYRKVRQQMDPDEFFGTPGAAADFLWLLRTRRLAVPKDQRNWSEVDSLLRDGLSHGAFQDDLAKLLRAEIAYERGEFPEAQILIDSVPLQTLPAKRILQLVLQAKVKESLKQYDDARRLLTECVQLDPKGRPMLAEFLGRHGTLDESLREYDASLPKMPVADVFLSALAVLKSRSAEVRPEHCQRVGVWGKQAVARTPDVKELWLGLVAVYELAGDLEQTIETYRGLLDKCPLSKYEKASVWNNLAYAVAVHGQNPKEAIELISRAIDVLGTTAALRDTRAIALLANGQTVEAIADLRQAVAEEPSGAKHFHLALAHQAAGDRQEAADTLKTAQDRFQFTLDRVPPGERQRYTRLVDWLKPVDSTAAPKQSR